MTAPSRESSYRWVVLASCLGIVGITAGVFYPFGVFFKPVQEEFGWGRGMTSLLMASMLLSHGMAAPIFGWLADRRGTRLPLMMAAILIGTGLTLAGRAGGLGDFAFYYILVGLGSGATWTLPMTTVQRWFQRKGLTLGITGMGLGGGALLFPILANYLVTLLGWRNTYQVTGIAFGSLLLLFAWLVLPQPGGVASASISSSLPPTSGLTMSRALRSPALWALMLVNSLGAFPVVLVMVHIVPFATDMGIPSAEAATTLGLLGAFYIPGMLVLGGFAERFGWQRMWALCVFAMGLASLWLLAVREPWMLYVFVAVFGFFHGGKIILLPGLLGFFFGTLNLAQIMGIIYGVGTLSEAGGPVAAGYIFDLTGSYSLAFAISALALALAGIICLLIRPPQQDRTMLY